MIKPAQLRAARALLGWSQPDLARASLVSRPTIARIELGGKPYDRTLVDLIRAFEEAGIEFIGETGVNLKEPGK